MAITVAQLPAYWRRIEDRVRDHAALDAANAMAGAFQGKVVRSLSGGSPSAPGSPPGRRSGTLARSVRPEEAVSSGAYSAESSVAPHTVYAQIQQAGGVIWAKHTLPGRALPAGTEGPLRVSDLGYLRFTIGGITRYARSVTLPARPYMVMDGDARALVRRAAIGSAARLVP